MINDIFYLFGIVVIAKLIFDVNFVYRTTYHKPIIDTRNYTEFQMKKQILFFKFLIVFNTIITFLTLAWIIIGYFTIYYGLFISFSVISLLTILLMNRVKETDRFKLQLMCYFLEIFLILTILNFHFKLLNN